jgi:hypothetical protein
MRRIVQLTGPNGAVQLFGVKLVGINGENGRKFLFTIAFIALVWLVAWGLGAVVSVILKQRSQRVAFWARQGCTYSAPRSFSSASARFGLTIRRGWLRLSAW